MTKNTEVFEGWIGPGRCDREITPLALSEDGLHIDLAKRGMYEWWYFDAHLNTGHTLVIFFHASNPNPGLTGKTGIEIVLLRPDGKRVQKFIPYSKQAFSASRDRPVVTIGKNSLRFEKQHRELPEYRIDVEEDDLGCDLVFKAQVNGWKPGTGLSRFGELGYFGWVVPFARASVEGTIRDGGQELQVSGIGYHDHNWLNFPFQMVIDYWMWGRVYSENFSVAYAYIQCNKKVANHVVNVLMLAEGTEVILSTGEFDFLMDNFEYSPAAGHDYPRRATICAPNVLKVSLTMNKVLEAQDMLVNYNRLLRLFAKRILGIKPGYFRLMSDFELEVTRDGKSKRETGSTLHEIVLFKPVRRGST